MCVRDREMCGRERETDLRGWDWNFTSDWVRQSCTEIAGWNWCAGSLIGDCSAPVEPSCRAGRSCSGWLWSVDDEMNGGICERDWSDRGGEMRKFSCELLWWGIVRWAIIHWRQIESGDRVKELFAGLQNGEVWFVIGIRGEVAARKSSSLLSSEDCVFERESTLQLDMSPKVEHRDH